MAVQLQVLDARGGGFYWHIISVGNGKILAASEVYTTKQAAVDTMRVVKRDTGVAALYDMTVQPPRLL